MGDAGSTVTSPAIPNNTNTRKRRGHKMFYDAHFTVDVTDCGRFLTV
nr:MAG TPA: hypothetical protein [Caudoviricetes sp.]